MAYVEVDRWGGKAAQAEPGEEPPPSSPSPWESLAPLMGMAVLVGVAGVTLKLTQPDEEAKR